MKSERVQKRTATKAAVAKQRSYNEVVEYLDTHWTSNQNDNSFSCIKQLDKALGLVSSKVDVVLLRGSNGKSLTAHFAAKLLKEEGLTTGILQDPHILTYNERLHLNGDLISNRAFTDLANKVIGVAEANGLEANSLDLLTMMALVHFSDNNIDVALIEVGHEGNMHPAHICTPKIVALTRVTDDNGMQGNRADEARIREHLATIKAGVHVVSADQGKLNLQLMQTVTEEQGGTWVMPIRKLAPLPYPFEQLHGRCAALAERIAHIYVNSFANSDAIIVESSLLTKKKGQRGRPTLEAKRQAEMHPRRTLEQFWKDSLSTLPGRFQLLDKEKPSILLDNADDLDAFQNLLLGIRLLHYQRPLKGLSLIIGNNNPCLNTPEFLKLLRYFFKKTSGNVFVYEAQPTAANTRGQTWDIETIANEIRNMKVKTVPKKSFAEAFEAARKTVDERHGLVVATGSAEVVADYWHHKGIKKTQQADS